MKYQTNGADAIYHAAHEFVEQCLGQGGSLFTPGKPIWSAANIEAFHVRFVMQPDISGENFLDKLRKQLAGASDEVVQLAAEMLYVYCLPAMPSAMGGEAKREMVSAVLAWLAHAVSIPSDLADTLDFGLVKPGTAFNTFRYQCVAFLVKFVAAWTQLSSEDRKAALENPWKFKQVVAGVDAKGGQSQRELLLHIVHPETFEDISSGKLKKQIITGLGTPAEAVEADVDRALLAIRERLEAERGDKIRFWEPALKARWSKESVSDDDDGGDPSLDGEDVGNSGVKHWKVAPGRNGRYWEACREGGFIGIGWPDLGDLTGVDKAGFDARMNAAAERKPSYARKGTRTAAWRFATKIKPGDFVIANDGCGAILGVGRVTGKYTYVYGQGELAHRLPVKWDDVTRRVVNEPGWKKTVVELPPAKFAKLTGGSTEVPHPPPNSGTTVDGSPRDAWNTALRSLLDEPVARLLRLRKNVVLYGPPGTGKTRAAIELRRHWEAWQGPNSVDVVTFHPTFAYEDFVEGFRPVTGGRFELRDGIFKHMCSTARSAPDRQFLLVIDELNRGDVARIFGELITLIEADKRGEISARLPYSHASFTVPNNLHLLGTMNTADRSISLLDIAFRRRFCFVEFPADSSVIRRSADHHQQAGGVDLAALLDVINARLARAGVDRDRAVGHSHFLIPKKLAALDQLRDKMRHDVIPLVQEYCYADKKLIQDIFGKLVDAEGRVNDSTLKDDEKLVAALTALVSEPRVDGEVP